MDEFEPILEKIDNLQKTLDDNNARIEKLIKDLQDLQANLLEEEIQNFLGYQEDAS